MKGVNFDRAAEYYDRTRAIPDWIEARCADTILQTVTPGRFPRLLEAGVGTGRISGPLMSRGATVVGIDISREMLRKNRSKLGGTEGANFLVRGDITALPFPDRFFDGIVAVHIFHLVPAWRQALDEAVRVLDRGGSLYLAGESGGCSSQDSGVRQKWLEILREKGFPVGYPGVGDDELIAHLLSNGATLETHGPWTWSYEHTVAEGLWRIENRVFSQAWVVPEDLLAESIRLLRDWIRTTHESLESIERYERAFTVKRLRFPMAGVPRADPAPKAGTSGGSH